MRLFRKVSKDGHLVSYKRFFYNPFRYMKHKRTCKKCGKEVVFLSKVVWKYKVLGKLGNRYIRLYYGRKPAFAVFVYWNCCKETRLNSKND